MEHDRRELKVTLTFNGAIFAIQVSSDAAEYRLRLTPEEARMLSLNIDDVLITRDPAQVTVRDGNHYSPIIKRDRDTDAQNADLAAERSAVNRDREDGNAL